MSRVTWDEKNITRLIGLSGKFTAREIAEKFGLSEHTIRNRLALIGVKPRSDLISMREACRQTGYGKHQLYRAKRALKQHWAVSASARGGKVGISDDQLEALTGWLKSEVTAPRKKRRSMDAYMTPPELAQAIVEKLQLPAHWNALEPSAGTGNFVRPLMQCVRTVAAIEPNKKRYEALSAVVGSRTNVTCYENTLEDFMGAFYGNYDLAIGNPPFSLAEDHLKWLRLRCTNVALLLRLSFLGSQQRWRDLWKGVVGAPDRLYVLTQRPSFIKGETDNSEYAVFCWGPHFRADAPAVQFIPPVI